MEAQQAQDLSRQRESEAASQHPQSDKGQESAPLQAVALAGGQPPAPVVDRQSPPAAPVASPPAAPPRPADAKPPTIMETPVKAAKGLGSKLASLAKATHEKADHSTKALPKPAMGIMPALAD